MSDKEMIEIIASALNYEFVEETDGDKAYGVSHSSKLYIIDRDGNMRVVWRGYDWTYASVYHDVVMLL
jgi:cytochrome oxidase Cu insertion factor (SCO1/SenC/PrrC family)